MVAMTKKMPKQTWHVHSDNSARTGMFRIRDPQFRAVQHEVVAVSFGRALERECVRTTRRLRQTECADL